MERILGSCQANQTNWGILQRSKTWQQGKIFRRMQFYEVSINLSVINSRNLQVHRNVVTFIGICEEPLCLVTGKISEETLLFC
jgi:hypothetical protein